MRRIASGRDESRKHEVYSLHSAPITSVEWSSDGKYLATGSYDGSVKVWEAETMRVRQTFLHARLVNGVRWSPDGLLLASGSADKTCRVWNLTTGQCIAAFTRHCDDVNSMAWSPDGRRIFTVSEDGTGRFWNVETSELLEMLLAHTDHCMAADWNRRLSIMATCGEDATIRFWDTAGRLATEVKQPGDLETCRWSPDGKLLAAAVDDGWVRIFDTDGKQVSELGPHSAPVKSVSWSPDALRLACGTYASSCLIWDINTKKCLETFHEPRLWPRAMHWNPTQEVVAVGTFDGRPVLLPTKANKSFVEVRERKQGEVAPTFGVNSLSAEDSVVFMGMDDGTVRSWSLENNDLVTIAGESGRSSLVNAVHWHKKQSLLAWGTFAGEVRVQKLDGSHLNLTEVGRTSIGVPVNQVAWNASGQLLAVADYEGRLSVFRVDGKGLSALGQYPIHNGAMKSLAWVSDTDLATGGTDRLVKLVTLEGEILKTFRGHGELVNWVSVAKSTNSVYIASASRDRTVRVWDCHSGNCLSILIGHDESVKSVAWKPGSTSILASGSYDFDVRVWNLESDVYEGEQSVVLNGHRNGVGTLAWLGERLLSASWDTTINLWPQLATSEDWSRYKGKIVLPERTFSLQTQALHLSTPKGE